MLSFYGTWLTYSESVKQGGSMKFSRLRGLTEECHLFHRELIETAIMGGGRENLEDRIYGSWG